MKILEILSQDKDKLEEKKIARIGRSLKRRQEALIDSLEAEKDKLQDKKDSLLSITHKTVKEDTWNEDLQNATVEITMIEKRIEIAKDTLTTYFADTVAAVDTQV